MSIGRKLFFAFSASLLALLAVGATGLVNLSLVRDQAVLIYTRNTQAMESLLAVTQDYATIRLLVGDLILGQDASQADGFEARLSGLEMRMQDNIDAYRRAAAQDETEGNNIFEGFSASYTAYQEITAKIFTMVRAGDFPGAVILLQDDGAIIARDLNRQVDGLVASNQLSASERYEASGQSAEIAFLATGIILVLAAILSLLSSFWLTRNLARPLVGTASLARRLAEGDLAIGTSGRTGNRKDEVGTLARAVDALTAKLTQFVGTLKDTGGALAQSARDLDAQAVTTAEAATRIAQTAVAGNALAEDQTMRIGEASTNVEEIVRQVESFDRVIESQVASVTQTTSAIEEMTSNIQNLSERAQNLGRAFSDLRTTSDDGRGKMFAMVEKIASISAQSHSLAEANDTIQSIAGQTNLLSMNAAIEAAHAGSAGAGFAVVADEIRKLAEQSAIHSKAITQEVKTIQALILQTSRDSETAKQAFGAVLERIEDLGRIETEITGALVEQNQGARQILEATSQMSYVSSQVRSGSAKILEGSREIAGEIRSVQEIALVLKGSLDQILADGAAITTAVARVQEDSARNRGLSADLDEVVGGFRL